MRTLVFLLFSFTFLFGQYDPDIERYEFQFRTIDLPEEQIEFDATLNHGDTALVKFTHQTIPLNNREWLLGNVDTTVYVENTQDLWDGNTANAIIKLTLIPGSFQYRLRAVVKIELVGNGYNARNSLYSNRLDFKLQGPLKDVAEVYIIWQ